MESENFKIAVGLLDTNKFDKAIEFFSKEIDANPGNADAYNLRGIAKFKIYDLDGAITDVSQALQIDNQNHQAWFNKGELLRHKKRYEEAEFYLRTANEIYPGSFDYLTALIRVSFSQKKCEECIGFCDQILKERPPDYIALFYRGLCFARQLKYLAAIKDYHKMIENGHSNSSVHCSLGFWYSKIGELKKAYNNLSISLEYNPTHPYSLNNMGYIKYLQNDLKGALELTNQSLEIDPSNSYAYKNRALIYLKSAQKDFAYADLIKAKGLGYENDHDNEVNELLKNNFKEN